VRVARIGTAISAAEKAAETASASLSKFTAASVGRSDDKTLSELDAALHAWRAAVRFVTEEQRPVRASPSPFVAAFDILVFCVPH